TIIEHINAAVYGKITALKNAQSPLIPLGGAAPTVLKNRGALQDIDQLSLLKSIVKMAGSMSMSS
ncbi:MAG: hypothetical protein PVI62_17395, partial [Desulfobacterales bacterium]